MKKNIAEVDKRGIMVDMTKGKNTIHVEVRKSSIKAIDAVIERTGMSKKEVIGRTIDWMADQSDDLQAVIFGHVTSQSQALLLRAAAEEMDRMAKLVESLPAPTAKKKKKKA